MIKEMVVKHDPAAFQPLAEEEEEIFLKQTPFHEGGIIFFYKVVYRSMITIMVCVFLALGFLRERTFL